jgi:hypothetical protein
MSDCERDLPELLFVGLERVPDSGRDAARDRGQARQGGDCSEPESGGGRAIGNARHRAEWHNTRGIRGADRPGTAAVRPSAQGGKLRGTLRRATVPIPRWRQHRPRKPPPRPATFISALRHNQPPTPFRERPQSRYSQYRLPAGRAEVSGGKGSGDAVGGRSNPKSV